MMSKLPFKRLTRTGIHGLDEILLGGIRSHNSIVIEGTVGTGKTLLATEFIYRGAAEFDEPGILITFSSSRERILLEGEDFEWNLQQLEGKGLFKVLEMTPAVLTDDIQSGGGILVDQILRLTPRRVAIDGLPALRTHIQSRSGITFSEWLLKLIRFLQTSGITAVMTTDIAHPSPTGETGSQDEQFLADTVISLSNRARGRGVHRSIEVVKSRGQDFFTGQHSLKILQGSGFKIYPRAPVKPGEFSPEDDQKTSSERISVGNSTLDEMLGGGVYLGSITLLAGISGTGKTVAGMQFLMEGARCGQKGLIISLDEHPQQIRRNAESLGIPLTEAESKSQIVIAYDGPLELNLDIHLQTIKDLIEASGARRVVIDSLSSYELIHPQEAREFIFALTAYLKRKLIASFYSYESPELLGVSQISKDIKVSAIVDNIVLLSYVEISTLLRRAITVPKARGSKPAQRTKEYVIQQGGISILDDKSVSDVPSVPQLPLSSYYGVLSRSPTRTSPVIDETLASGKDLPRSHVPKPGERRKKRKTLSKR